MKEYKEHKDFEVGTVLVPYEIPEDDFNGIQFVAEAPGAEEEEQETPLVGTSGQKFNAWLKKCGISRSNSIISNTFRFRPLNNKIDKFFCSDKIAREQEIEISTRGKCRGKNLILIFEKEIHHLISSIVNNKPQVIVTMGGIPTWALLGLDKITSVQGNKFVKTFEHKGKKHHCTVLPCFHPSAALDYRDPSGEREKQILKVLKMAKKLVEK